MVTDGRTDTHTDFLGWVLTVGENCNVLNGLAQRQNQEKLQNIELFKTIFFNFLTSILDSNLLPLQIWMKLGSTRPKEVKIVIHDSFQYQGYC